ncbi:Major intrinsic protein [Neofusicoccum parvum]|uniref:Major intrinsic protein n=1 Tax=Neofusicoccum parvum TaxID=310453 RepID=A0ACB5S7M2_9PEZI|nr:Major intrinsic protein [Neofusicoccum parvum]
MNITQPSEKYMVMPGRRKKRNDNDVERQAPQLRRLRGFSWLPNKIRNHFIAMLGEFVGTFLFLFFAFSATQIANTVAKSSTSGTPNTSDLLFISLAFGFSLAVNVWAFFRISGGLFNPAVTLGMCLIGAVGWIRGGLIFLSQIIGAIAAAGIVSALFPGNLNVRTTLTNTSIARGLFIEMFLTAMLVFTVFMLAAEKHKGTFLAPVGIGLALFVAEMSGVYFTGGSLNPARSFGPDVILHTFDGYHWIYWVGPALGSLLAVVMYRLIKTLEYETANPGQDFDENEIEAFDPGQDPQNPEDVRRLTGTSAVKLGPPSDQSGSPVAHTYSNDATIYAPSSRHSNDPKHLSPESTPRSPTFPQHAGRANGHARNPSHPQQNISPPTNDPRHAQQPVYYPHDPATAFQPPRQGHPVQNGHVDGRGGGDSLEHGRSRRSSEAAGQLPYPHQMGGPLGQNPVYPPAANGGHRHFSRDPEVYQGDDGEERGRV